jgi:hypothetical protein
MVVWAGRRRPALHRSGAASRVLIEDAQCSVEGGASCLRILRWERDVDVFEDGAWSDAAKTQRRLDEIIARNAGVFASERVGEKERFGELTGAHKETSAVDGP